MLENINLLAGEEELAETGVQTVEDKLDDLHRLMGLLHNSACLLFN